MYDYPPQVGTKCLPVTFALVIIFARGLALQLPDGGHFTSSTAGLIGSTNSTRTVKDGKACSAGGYEVLYEVDSRAASLTCMNSLYPACGVCGSVERSRFLTSR